MQHKNQRNLTALVAIALLATSLGAAASGQIFRWKIGGGGAPNGDGVLSAAPAGQPFGPRLPGNANWSYLDLTVDGPNDASGNLPVTYRFASKIDGSQVTQSGVVSGATVGGLLRSRVFSGAGSSIASRLTAAGYSADPQGSSIGTPEQTTVLATGYCDASPIAWRSDHGYTATGCTGYGRALYPNHSVDDLPCNTGSCSAAVRSGSGSVWFYYYWHEDAGATVTETTPAHWLTDEELAAWGYTNLTAGELRGLFLDPSTGAPLPIPEAQSAMDAL